ncbi:MAG: type II secretion system F family protein [Actinobacteria bacterium]|nr:type II secretion system F family protein [Actinomycetota bacterium]MCL6105234.1 type II secretion system F family protein [Actinomycetota bacterium]
MTIGMLAGAGVGVGLMTIWLSIRRNPVNLSNAIDYFETSKPKYYKSRHLTSSISAKAVATGFFSKKVTSDLDVTGSNIEVLVTKTIWGAIIGAAAPSVIWILLQVMGHPVNFETPFIAVLLLSIIGAFYPKISLASKAKQARKDLRHATGVFLDLVSLAQAAGMGLEGALKCAGQISTDWTFRRIVQTVDRTTTTTNTVWASLEELGSRLGITELSQLSANLNLAGTEGARIRTTLAAQARSLRRKEQSEAETEANAVTEKMFVPGIIMMFGFTLLMVYPAAIRILGAL